MIPRRAEEWLAAGSFFEWAPREPSATRAR